MVYTWGTKPSFGTEEPTSEGYVFPKGEYGVIRGYTWETAALIGVATTEEQFANKFLDKIKAKGGIPLYVSVRREFIGLAPPQFKIRMTVEECYFKGDPVLVDDIIAALILIAVLGIAFYVLFPGVVYKIFGVTPTEAAAYNIAQVPVLIPFIIIIFLVVVVFAGWPGRKR